MKTNRKTVPLVMFGLFMILLILKPQPAFRATITSLDLCIRSIIPGMFPFLFLSIAISSVLIGYSCPIIERLLHIPKGAAANFLIGLLCGYPVGAKLIQTEIDKSNISRENGARMMVFCNNASPAFIIGVLSPILADVRLAIMIWLIQLCASVLVGIMLPPCKPEYITGESPKNIHWGEIMTQSLKTMAAICGWVLIISVFIGYLQTPVLDHLDTVSTTLISGFMELTNGVYKLTCVYSPSLRLIISSILLSLGGVCVLLQTKSVAPSLVLKTYITGRILHSAITGFLTSIACIWIVSASHLYICYALSFLIVSFLIILVLYFNKKW